MIWALQERQQQQPEQYFVTSQLNLNPLAPQVATLIEAGQDNQSNKKRLHAKNYMQIRKEKQITTSKNRTRIQKQQCN